MKRGKMRTMYISETEGQNSELPKVRIVVGRSSN